MCVLFLGFRNIPQRNDIATFSGAKWSEKFKLVFDITDPGFKNLYAQLHGLAKFQRNPAAHGYMTTIFDFYLEGARYKIPVALTDHDVAVEWRSQPNNFGILDEFFKIIRTHKSTSNIFLYINSGLNITFMKDSLLENDTIPKLTKADLREYLFYNMGVSDNMGNMDWCSPIRCYE